MARLSAISTILQPLAAFYDDPATVEMRINAPKKVVIDRRGEGKHIVDAPELTLARIEDLCKSLANYTGVKFHPKTAPKLSCVIPEVMHRFEALVGASTRSGVSLAIRCKHPFTPTWEDLGIPEDGKVLPRSIPLVSASAPKSLFEYLKQTVQSGKNLVVSGATNTGKTTLVNKLLKFLPDDCRVVAAEDTPELHLERFWDGVGLLAAREESSSSGMVTWRELYDHKMRITPDRVIFGEISTQNAFAALGALNSGVTGFMCTIHAESPEQVLNRKFVQNIAWAGQQMHDIPEFLRELVDVIVQIKRSHTGYRRITDIYEPRTDRWVMKNELMLETGLHVVQRPRGEAS